MKKFLLFLIVFSLVSQVAFADFSDVKEDYSYVKAVNWLQANGVVKGYDDGSYRPDQLVNRAEFVKMLYETMGRSGDYKNKPIQPFTDVDGSEWYGGYVTNAYMDDYVDGYEDGTFKPADTITTAEALKIVMNAFFLKGDELLSTYVKDNTDWVQNKCVYHNSNYEKVTVAIKNLDQGAWFASYINSANTYCLIPKQLIEDSSANAIFDPNKKLTRGEMAEFLYRAKAVLDNYRYTEGPDGGYGQIMPPYNSELNSQVPKAIVKAQ